MRALSEAAVF